MSVGKILLLLVNLKYLIILIIYFHLQNLCSSKSVSRHLLIIILIFFFFQRGGELGGESWGMGSVLINYFSEEISLESHPWFSYTGAQKGQSGMQVCGNAQGGMGWAGLSLPRKSPPFPQRISGMWTGDVMGPVP